ncbi:MAG: hypothetical protein KFH87_06720, partial [Bacteroidetes bacterium]|nr:hypothetical protein [Bacteroidota bacterium]
MKRSGYKLLPLLLIALFCCSPLSAMPGDTLVYKRPMYFTANAGQWDEEVRYAMLGDRTSSWFGDDGIILARPRQSRELPGETPHIPEDGTPMETLHIDFVNPSPAMRIVALDTTRAVSHFYLHPDSTGWYEHVRNHRGIRYENVWEGVDIEYRPGAGSSLQQSIRLQPGADASRIALRVRGAEAGEVRNMLHESLSESVESEVTRPGEDARISGDIVIGPGFRFKDTLHLTTEFNTAFRFTPQNRPGDDYMVTLLYDHVVSERGEVTVMGYTESASLPVRNALQGTLRGISDRFVMRFDSTGREYLYCTYIGGAGGENFHVWGYGGHGYSHDTGFRLLDVDENDRIYAVAAMTEGAPLKSNSYRTYQPYGAYTPDPVDTVHNSIYLFGLEANGILYAATYLGGPGGWYYARGLMLSDQGVHVLINNQRGKLPVTEGVLMPEKQCDNCPALHLTCLDFELSSPVYETWVISTDLGADPSNPGAPPVHTMISDFVAHGDGEVSLAVSNQIARRNLKSPDDKLISPGTLWVGRIDAGGKQLLHSTLIPENAFPHVRKEDSRIRMRGRMHTNSHKELFISGSNRMREDWSADSLSPVWRTQELLVSNKPELTFVQWMLHIDEDGAFNDGLLLGTGAFYAHYPSFWNNTCKGITMFAFDTPEWLDEGAWKINTTLDPYNSVSTWDDGHPHRYIIDIDERMQVRYGSYWNAAYHIPALFTDEYRLMGGTIDRHGYCYLSYHSVNPFYIRERLVFHNSWRLPKQVPEEWPSVPERKSYADTYLTRFRLHTPCWLVGCGIAAVDTLRMENRRAYAEPEQFELRFAVHNHSPEKGARILHALIELPAGFELVGGTPMQAMTPETLSAGMTAECSWTLRVADATLLGDTASVRCRVFYVDPESGQTWPPGEELCEHDIHILRFDEEDPDLVCTVEG